MEITRRGFLVGGAAALVGGGTAAIALVESGIVPGRVLLDHALGRCDVNSSWPKTAVGTSERGTFPSDARKRDVGFVISWPPGSSRGDPLPVLLLLHGRGSSADQVLIGLHLDAFLAAHVAGGGRPFALACAEGADRYWHPRTDGDDPLRMLTDEFLPMLRTRGLRTDPMGVLGWSMGGYGALLWARLATEGALPSGVRLTVAVAESPALFRSYRATTSGSFDSAADFAQWGDLLARPGVDTNRTALRVDCGAHDPFTAVTRDYRRNVLPAPDGAVTKGCHTTEYWRGRAAEQFAFVGQHLSP